MTTTPTATISTDIAELGGVTGAIIPTWQERMAPSDEGMATAEAIAMLAEIADLRAHLSAAPVAPEPAAAQGDLTTALTVFDMGLGFALCHRDFGAIRNAIKKLQTDFSAICAMLAPQPLAEVSAAQAVPEGMKLMPREMGDAHAHATAAEVNRKFEKDQVTTSIVKMVYKAAIFTSMFVTPPVAQPTDTTREA